MKLAVFLTLMTVIQVTAGTMAQTITLEARNQPLLRVMEQIKKQSGYHFFLKGEQLAKIRVNTTIQKADLRDAMDALTSNLGISWVIKDNVIIVRAAAQPTVLRPGAVVPTTLQERVVTGRVTDETAVPLEGVTVAVKGTPIAVITDADGNYRVTLPPNANTLVFSIVGFQPMEQAVGSQSAIDIVLRPSMSDLDEVVVVGYGTQRKGDLTGAVSQVKGETIAERNAVQLSQALQGTIPGLRVTRTGSNPNSGATIRVRGITTIGTSDPLIIVDGVPSTLDRVNAADVESISVLKDAASAAIYGARAAAGVILVTTKRAVQGTVSFDYSYEYGFERPTAIPEEVDAQSYMRIYNERFWNDNDNAPGGEHSFFDKDIIDNYPQLNRENPNIYPITNWFDMMLRSYAPRQAHNINFTAGGEHVRTKASLDYAKVAGINLLNDYDRITFRVNNDFTINSKLGGLIDVNGIRTVNDVPRTMATPNTIAPGVIYAATWSDGRIAEGLAGANPYAQVTEGGFIKGTDNVLSGRIGINFKPFEGFKLSGLFAPTLTFGAVKNFSKQIPYTPWDNPDHVAGYIVGYAATNLMEERTNAFTHITQLIASYDTKIASHNLEALLGYENYYTTNESLTASRENFQLSSFPYLNLGNANYQFNSGGASEVAYRSWFGRITYNYASKYLLQLNGRYDLSSRFAKQHRGAFFPSVSAGWVVSEEAFLADVPWLSHLKARASWGMLGNERIGDNYPYQSTIGFANSTVYQGTNPVSTQGAAVNRYAIPNITWETTESYDFGIDVNLFDNRLAIVADYYRKTTRDMLLELEIPRYIGLQNPNQNAGQMYTRGWELEAGWQDNIGKLGYRVSFNITDSESIMGDLRGTQFIGNQVIMEGHEYNAWYGYLSDGLFQTADEVANHPTINSNVAPGDIKLLDISGPDGVPDGRISPEYDRVVLGGSLARYLYGGNIKLDYKGLDFSLFVQGVGKQNAQMPLAWVLPVTRIPKVTQGDYWSVYNTEAANSAAAYPRVSGFYQANNYASLVNYWLFNGAYFRLKNVTLGYTLPQPWTAKIGAQRLRLYATATDLFSLSNYPSDRDPEGSANFITTSYVFGLSVNF